jgi:hypothetical protein
LSKEHIVVDGNATKDNANRTSYPQPNDIPHNNSNDSDDYDDDDGDDDNNKNKGKNSNDNDNDKNEQAKEGPFVDLGYSQYEGNVLSSDIHEYLGIRYAKATSGDMRWRAPVEPDSTTEVLKAQKVYALTIFT